jgi:hypothetical protein
MLADVTIGLLLSACADVTVATLASCSLAPTLRSEHFLPLIRLPRRYGRNNCFFVVCLLRRYDRNSCFLPMCLSDCSRAFCGPMLGTRSNTSLMEDARVTANKLSYFTGSQRYGWPPILLDWTTKVRKSEWGSMGLKDTATCIFRELLLQAKLSNYYTSIEFRVTPGLCLPRLLF